MVGDSPQDFAVGCSVSVRLSAAAVVVVVVADIGEREPRPVEAGSREWWVVEVVVVKVVAVVVVVEVVVSVGGQVWPDSRELRR